MSLYDFEVAKRKGEMLKLSELKGKVILIVNTATGCGFTPQYETLENLYKKYHEQGFEILDFPCDQFGHQAPGSDEEIHEFCTAKYKTTFDQLKKIEVNGENADPVWKYIKENSPEEFIKGFGHKATMKAITKMSKSCEKDNDIKWNFTKFLVDREGNICFRYAPIESPEVIEADIVKLLNK